MSGPSINWESFPLLPQNSPHIPTDVPPPRPPKPPYLTETSTKPKSRSRSNNSCTNDALSKASGNIFTHKFGKNDSRKVDKVETSGLESTSSIDSLSILDRTSLTPKERTQALPIIGREEKSKIYQFPTDTVRRLPLTPTTFPFNPQPWDLPKISHKDKESTIEGKLHDCTILGILNNIPNLIYR